MLIKTYTERVLDKTLAMTYNQAIDFVSQRRHGFTIEEMRYVMLQRAAKMLEWTNDTTSCGIGPRTPQDD